MFYWAKDYDFVIVEYWDNLAYEHGSMCYNH